MKKIKSQRKFEMAWIECFGNDLSQYYGKDESQYLVLQRSVLTAMPSEFQRKLVALLEELDHTVDFEKVPSMFSVVARNNKGQYSNDEFADYKNSPEIPLK
jgi:hypothetical protein